MSGIGEGRMANPDITWEVATKYNLGLELGFWDALKLNADVFYEKRENIFLTPQVSEITGIPMGQTMYANMGVMENRGFEVSAEYGKQINKDWFISVRGNFTFTRNEIMTSNEVRQIIGMKPANDPSADELRNKNLSVPADQQQLPEEGGEESALEEVMNEPL